MPNKQQQQSFKNLRHNNLASKQQAATGEKDQHPLENEPLNIQAKSILNPQLAKQDSQASFLSKIAQQSKIGASQSFRGGIAGGSISIR